MVNVSSKKRRFQNTKNDETIEREYQVEAILDKRIRGKKTQYLLKWKDYSDEHNTVGF
jgi:predicted ATPase